MIDVIIKVVTGCTNKKKDSTPSKIIISNKNVMIATKYFKSTKGCVAIKKNELIKIIKIINKNTKIKIS